MPLVNKISDKISKELGYDSAQSEVIAYGLFAVMQITASLVLVTVFGLIFKIVGESLVFSFSASILRQYSGGVHASKPSICLVIGTAVTIVLACAAHALGSVIGFLPTAVIAFFSFAYSYYIVYRYAPVDSAAKPIRTDKKRKRMRKISFAVLSVYLLVIILLATFFKIYGTAAFAKYILTICFACLWQVFNLTVIGHKILATADSFLKKIIRGKERGNKT